MSFTITDFHDLVELLEQNPAWRAELRRLVLTDDILTLPQFVRDLAQTVAELADAQKEMADAQKEMADAQKRTEERLTRLENRIGVTTEEEAADVLRVVLEQKGYRAVKGPFNLRLNGEVDVVLPVQAAGGQRLSAVLEAKVRLGWRTVEAWANRMRSSDFRAALQAAGVAGPYLVYTYGMRADVSARQAAEKFGVGLLTGRGEEVPPQGVIEESE